LVGEGVSVGVAGTALAVGDRVGTGDGVGTIDGGEQAAASSKTAIPARIQGLPLLFIPSVAEVLTLTRSYLETILIF